MTDPLGAAIVELAENRRLLPHDEGPGVTIARFYQKHGKLTPAMTKVVTHILSDRTYDMGSTMKVEGAVPKPITRASEVRFDVKDGFIRAKTPFALKDTCKAVPGRKWNPDLKVWEWIEGPIAAMNLRDAFARWNPDWDVRFGELLDELDKASEFKVATDLEDLPNLKTVAWNHQRQAYHFIRGLKSAALFMDMGTGKSLIVVSRSLEVARHTLIVCPKKVLGVWPREFRRHGDREVHIENGMRPKRGGGWKALKVSERTEAFRELRNCDCGRRHVAVVNYEATINEPMKTFLAKSPWDLIVFDESHRIKGYSSVTSKHLAKVKAPYKLALTGTAMPHSPLDIFGQYRALDVGVFGNNYTSFRHQWALWSGYEDRDFDGMNPLRLDEFNSRVYSIAFRVEAGDVLDLPPVLPDQQLYCTLEGAQEKAYRDIEKEMHAEFPGLVISKLAESLVDGESTSQNKLAQMTRLRQLTGGALNDNEGRSVIIGEAKAGLLKDYLMDLPATEPVVIFCAYVADLDVVKRVTEKMRRRYGEVSGRRDDLTADSEYPENVDVLAVQIAAGGSGVDLTRSCYGCYYSKDFSLGNYRQTRSRLDRPGQTRPVRFHHLTALDTLDEYVDEALFERQQLIDVVQDPKHQKKAE